MTIPFEHLNLLPCQNTCPCDRLTPMMSSDVVSQGDELTPELTQHHRAAHDHNLIASKHQESHSTKQDG